MGQLTQKDLRTPFNGASIRKIRGRIDKVESEQAAAATLTTLHVLDLKGNIQDLTFIASALPAGGESLVVDVQKNGVTVLNTTLTYDSTITEIGVLRFDWDVDTTFDPGDVVSVIRTYVAGGGATPIGTSKVVLEVA